MKTSSSALMVVIAVVTAVICYHVPIAFMAVPMMLGAVTENPWHRQSLKVIYGGCLFGTSIPFAVWLLPYGQAGIEMLVAAMLAHFVMYGVGTYSPLRRVIHL